MNTGVIHMFNALLPKGAPFFELLLEQNKMLCTIAATLTELVENTEDINEPHQRIAELEAKADLLHLSITKHLSHTFITPIDREDILHINKIQEEAIDQLHNMANRLYIFEFKVMRFPMKQLARTLQAMVLLTRSMLNGLSKKKDSHDSREFRALKDECEMLLNMGLVELHDLAGTATPGSFPEILKWSQAYDRMEMAVDQVLELAEIIEEAVLKNV